MKRRALLLILLLIIALLGGCKQTPVTNGDTPAGNPPAAAGENQTSGNQTGENQPNAPLAGQTADYSSYQGEWKLKIESDELLYRMTALMEYMGSTGISIKEIKNGELQGSIYAIQGPPSYRQAEVDFNGKIEQGRLEAAYEDKAWEYRGKIVLTFADNMIQAVISREKSETAALWGIPEGEFTFVKAIPTERADLSAQEKENLEDFLRPAVKDAIQPFAEGSLTDEAIIQFVGYNLALGLLDTSEFKDQVTSGAELVFTESVMNALAKKYFGAEIRKHRTVDFTVHDGGKYTVPALGGVTEYPQVGLLLQDQEKAGIYYAIVDYLTENPAEGKKLAYQRLFTLQKNGGYLIKSVQDVDHPIVFEI